MIEALRHGFSHYFDFSSRTSRALFWYWVLANFLVVIVLSLIDAFVVNPALGITGEAANTSRAVTWLYSLIILVPATAIAVRRLRDAGHSPWLILLALIPFLNLILIYFYVQPSKDDHGS